MKKLILIAILIVGFDYLSLAQTKLEPSTAFKNHIAKVNSELNKLERFISESKLDSAILLLKKLPEEISGFSFLYTGDATNLSERHKEQLSVLNIKIDELNSKIVSLQEENKSLKGNMNKEIVKVIEEFLNKKYISDKDIENLKDQIKSLNKDKLELTEQKTRFKSEVIRLNDSIKVIKSRNEFLTKDLKTFYAAVKVGLSIGFNGFVNNQLDYIVKADSTVRESGNRSGVSGIISAVVVIRLDPLNRNNIMVNVPLGDFTSNANQAIGLFNQRIAVGLGYARRISKVSPNLLLSASINISPYEQIDFNEIKSKKVKLPEYSKLKPENYGASTGYSYSVTIGIVYTFNSGKE